MVEVSAVVRMGIPGSRLDRPVPDRGPHQSGRGDCHHPALLSARSEYKKCNGRCHAKGCDLIFS